MNTKKHPITWYHQYDGGRIFYTKIKHTNKIYNNLKFKKLLLTLLGLMTKLVVRPGTRLGTSAVP